MKSLIKKLKQKIYRFLTSEINSKLDKILMLESALLAQENMRFFNNFYSIKSQTGGGGD